MDKNALGYVYIRLDSTEAATLIQQKMKNRLFSGRLVDAEFLSDSQYNARFPELKINVEDEEQNQINSFTDDY